MKAKIHFSIDDVKGIFNVLAKEEMSSIFETRSLGFLREINQKYGCCFDLFCTYSNKDYCLKNVSERYKEEFIANNDWLRLGFHCYSEIENGRPLELFIKDFEKTQIEINRVAGQKNPLTMLRLDRFEGSETICCYLASKGVNRLLTADDERNSYYLDDEETCLVNSNGIYCDEKTGITFVKTLIRLEKKEDILEKLEFAEKQKYPIVSVFTHERMLDDYEVREKFEWLCKYSVEKFDRFE